MKTFGLQQQLMKVREAVRPQAPYLIGRDRSDRPVRLSYGDAAARVDGLGGLFRSWDLVVGDRVVVAATDDAAVLTLVLACLYHGLSAAVVDPDSTAGEAGVLLGIVRPSAIIADQGVLGRWPCSAAPHVLPVAGASRRPTLRDRLLRRRRTQDTSVPAFPGVLDGIEPVRPPVELADDAEALVLFTSGSTSRPKGVRLSRRNLGVHLETVARKWGYTGTSRVLDILPLHHADGLLHGAVAAWMQGATLLRPMVFSVPGIPDLLEAVYREAATHVVAVPTILAAIDRYGVGYEDTFREAGIPFVISTAGPLDEGLWERFEKRFNVRVTNTYGLTETTVGGVFCGPGDASYARGTLGKATDCEVRLLDPATGEPPRDGEPGELLLLGDNVMMGYLGDDDATAAVMHDGWLRTGDLATIDEAGFVRLAGRLKNIVVTGGQNVQPEEVTTVLKQHPQVADAVAFGVPDETFGEVVGACVVPAAGAALNAAVLADFCREALSEFKIPKHFAIAPELPLGPAGKPVVERARQLLSDASSPRVAASDVTRGVLESAAEAFRSAVSGLSLESSPDDTVGWDSFAHLNLIVNLEQAFDIRFEATEIVAVRRLADAAAAVRRKLGS